MSRTKVIAAFLLAVTIGGAFLYVSPLIERHTAIVDEVSAKQTELESVLEKKSEAERSKREFEALSRAEKERYLNAFPSGTEQETVVNNAVDVAQAVKLDLSSLSFSKNLNQSNPKRLSIVTNFTGAGDASAVLNLIKGIEKSKRLLSIRGLSFLLTKGRQDYTLTLEGYYK